MTTQNKTEIEITNGTNRLEFQRFWNWPNDQGLAINKKKKTYGKRKRGSSISNGEA